MGYDATVTIRENRILGQMPPPKNKKAKQKKTTCPLSLNKVMVKTQRLNGILSNKGLWNYCYEMDEQ